MIPKTIVHLLSGGLDSTTCLRMLLDEGHNVFCLLVNYGQQHSKELWFAEHACKRWGVKFKTIDLPGLGGLTEEDRWIVKNRNFILIGHAVNLAAKMGFETVTLGCNKDDESGFPDCRMAFLQLVNTVNTTQEMPIEVCAPFIEWPKWKIAALAQQMGIKSEDVWWCYRGGEVPCGSCPACLKQAAATGCA